MSSSSSTISSSSVLSAPQSSSDDYKREMDQLVRELEENKAHPVHMFRCFNGDCKTYIKNALRINNYPYAYYGLAIGYKNNEDFANSYKWMLRAAEGGVAYGMYYVGVFLSGTNPGCPRNLEKAIFWLSRASQSYSKGNGTDDDLHDSFAEITKIANFSTSIVEDRKGIFYAAVLLHNYGIRNKENNTRDYYSLKTKELIHLIGHDFLPAPFEMAIFMMFIEDQTFRIHHTDDHQKREECKEFLIFLKICKRLYDFYDATFSHAEKKIVLNTLEKHLRLLPEGHYRDYAPSENGLRAFFFWQWSKIISSHKHLAKAAYDDEAKENKEYADLNALVVTYPESLQELKKSNEIKAELNKEHIPALFCIARLLEERFPKEACCFYLKLYISTLIPSPEREKLSQPMLEALRQRAKKYFSHLALGAKDSAATGRWALQLIESIGFNHFEVNAESKADNVVYALTASGLSSPDWDNYSKGIACYCMVSDIKKTEVEKFSLLMKRESKALRWVIRTFDDKAGEQKFSEKLLEEFKKILHLRENIIKDKNLNRFWIIQNCLYVLVFKYSHGKDQQFSLLNEMTEWFTRVENELHEPVGLVKEKSSSQFKSIINSLLNRDFENKPHNSVDSVKARLVSQFRSVLNSLLTQEPRTAYSILSVMMKDPRAKNRISYLLRNWAVMACSMIADADTALIAEALKIVEGMNLFFPRLLALKMLGPHIVRLNDEGLNQTYVNLINQIKGKSSDKDTMKMVVEVEKYINEKKSSEAAQVVAANNSAVEEKSVSVPMNEDVILPNSIPSESVQPAAVGIYPTISSSSSSISSSSGVASTASSVMSSSSSTINALSNASSSSSAPLVSEMLPSSPSTVAEPQLQPASARYPKVDPNQDLEESTSQEQPSYVSDDESSPVIVNDSSTPSDTTDAPEEDKMVSVPSAPPNPDDVDLLSLMAPLPSPARNRQDDQSFSSPILIVEEGTPLPLPEPLSILDVEGMPSHSECNTPPLSPQISLPPLQVALANPVQQQENQVIVEQKEISVAAARPVSDPVPEMDIERKELLYFGLMREALAGNRIAYRSLSDIAVNQSNNHVIHFVGNEVLCRLENKPAFDLVSRSESNSTSVAVMQRLMRDGNVNVLSTIEEKSESEEFRELAYHYLVLMVLVNKNVEACQYLANRAYVKYHDKPNSAAIRFFHDLRNKLHGIEHESPASVAGFLPM